MKVYKDMTQLLKAVVTGEIPVDCGTPSWAAEKMGISRSAVHARIHKSGTLEAWGTEDGYILVSNRSVQRAIREKQGIPETQGELDGFAIQ